MSVRVPTALTDDLIGRIVGDRYRVESRLGEGAMGMVYRASHVRFERAFALKILHSHLTADPKMAQRFEREALLAARVRHTNVIGIVDVGETPDGRRYIAMDLAAGTPLANVIWDKPMESPRIIQLVGQMLDGLFAAHEAGLIHRDFKPENVIVELDDFGREVPRIVDFGIAILRDGDDSSAGGPGRLTTAGLVVGTPQYMAPEQTISDPIDHRVDLFALGVIVYQMLCGKLPFEGSGVTVARSNLLLDPPPIAERTPDVTVDPLLEAFARKLLAKNRNERPATARVARELLDLVERDRSAAAVALGVEPERATGGDLTRAAPVSSPIGSDAADGVDVGRLPTVKSGAFERPRTRSRYWILAALGAAALVVLGVLATRPDPPRPDEPRPETAVVYSDGGVTTRADASAIEAGSAAMAALSPPADVRRDAAVATTEVHAVAAADAGVGKLPTPRPEPVASAERPAINASNLRERYEGVQRLLKQRGSNEMWDRFLRIDLNNAMLLPEKQREAIAILTTLEAALERR
jgi:serine/threonine-protein kinase